MLYWFWLNFLSSSKSKSHWCTDKIEVKIPQLTLGELAQMDRHCDKNTKVVKAGSIPTEEIAEINLPFTTKQHNIVLFLFRRRIIVIMFINSA